MLGWLSALAPHCSLGPYAGDKQTPSVWHPHSFPTVCIYSWGTYPVLLCSYLLTRLWGPLGSISFGRTVSSASLCSPAGTWRCWYSINICEVNKQMKTGQHVTIISNRISVSVTPEYSKEGLFVPTSPFWRSSHRLPACMFTSILWKACDRHNPQRN